MSTTRAALVLLPLSLAWLVGCPATPTLPGSDGGPDGGEPDADRDGGAFEVTGVLPRRGPLSGGTRVTVSGRGFAEPARLLFGEGEAGSVEVVSAEEILCVTPEAGAAGAVDVTVEGEDGARATLPGGFTYEAAPPAAIDRCRLEGPATMTAPAGGATETVTGLVFSAGATEAAGQAPGIRGELGLGPDGSDPSGAGWTWVGASFGGDAEDEDRYGASTIVSAPGAYDYALRFSADDGASWTLCDLDGSETGGYSPDQAGALAVVDSELPRVDWCRLERPASTTAAPGAATETVFGQVFEPGVTDAAGQGRGVRAQVGFGPRGSSPTGAEWVFRDASWAADVGDNDEYGAALEAGAPGAHDVAYRFSLDGGGSWLYCDRSGSDDGYDPADAGSLLVEVPTDPEVDWCVLQWPPSAGAEPGVASPPIVGRVYEPGLTDRAGAGSGLAAQLGSGPPGSDPATSAEWAWADAAYNADYGSNDEYAASLTLATEGSYDYAYRFSLDGTRFLYCDLDGSSDGYDPADAGRLVVAPAGPRLPAWCRLQWPLATSTLEGLPTELVYGQVFEPGVTDAAGMGAGVTAELGFGPDGSEPATSLAWTWVAAAYNVDSWANDEYMAVLVPPAPGPFDYAFRFSLDGGLSWLHCDGDGSTDGYDPADAGDLEVAAAETVDWCGLQWPHVLAATTGLPTEAVYGRVFERGVTDAAGMGPGVTAEVGYGPDGTDPGTAGWTWFAAAYNTDDGPANDEYLGTMTPAAAGVFDFAYRFSLDGGLSWVSCDRDGSSDGYSPADAGELTVTD